MTSGHLESSHRAPYDEPSQAKPSQSSPPARTNSRRSQHPASLHALSFFDLGPPLVTNRGAKLDTLNCPEYGVRTHDARYIFAPYVIILRGLVALFDRSTLSPTPSRFTR